MSNTTSVWGLNEKGELVAVAGTGTSNIVGFLNEDFVPTDNQGRLVIAGLGGGGTGDITAVKDGTNVVDISYQGNKTIDLITGRARPVRAFVWGDSITNYGQYPAQDPTVTSTSAQLAFTTRSWYARASAKLGGRLNIVGMRGRAGKRLDEIVSYFATDVLPSKPSLLILEGGSNDLDAYASGYSAVTAFAAIMAIYRLCQANGIALLYVGTPAGSTLANQRGAGQPVTDYPKLHGLAIGAAQRLRGFMFFDMAVALRDYTTGNATPTNMVFNMSLTSAFAADNTHPSAYGNKLLGDALAAFLDPLLSKQPFRMSSNTGGASGNPMQLVSNNLLGFGSGIAGTSGPGGSAAASNSIPDRYDIRRSTGTGITGVITNVARTDGGPGKGAQIAVSGAAADTDMLEFSNNLYATTNLGNLGTFGITAAIGTTCRGEVELSQVVTTGVINNINLVVNAWSSTTDSTTSLGQWEASKFYGNDGSSAYNGAATDYVLDNASTSLLLRTPDFVLPVGTHHVSISVQIMTSTGAVTTITVMNPQIISDQWTALLPAGYF